MFKSIQWRLTSVYLLIIAVSLSALGGYFIWRIEAFYMENLEKHMLNKAVIAAELFSVIKDGGSTSLQDINELCKDLGVKTDSRITYIAEDGTVIGDSFEDVYLMENHRNRPEVKAALEMGKGVSLRYSSTADMGMYYAAMVIDKGSAAGDIVRFSVPLSFIKGSIAQLRLILLSVLLFVLTIAAVLSLRFSRSLINPIEEIGSVARFISSGNFDRKVLFKSDDELGVLARTINNMGETLKEKVWQISQEKSKLETVMSAMTNGVILFNSSGNVDFINDAAEKIFGVKRENAVGLSLQAAFRNFVLYENLQEVLKNGALKSFELNLFVPETRVLQVHMVAVTAGQPEKEIMGALTVLNDITGLRSLERMRSEFVANVSHELRTPLTVIKGYAETLLDETNWEKPVVVKNILTIIDREAERLARLLKDLLDLSRIESSKSIMRKQELNIFQVLADAKALLKTPAEDKIINVSIHHPQEDIKLIQGDPDWLLQLFIDILDNSIKYTPQGGSIDIKIEQSNREVIISIQDTGIGIPAKNIPYIFERFYRVDKARSRRFGGTGLGLAIVKHVVDAHNGRVEVKSTVGVGTIFSIFLPIINE